jgi:hypothetical protein
MLSDVVGMVPGCQTDSRGASPVLAAAVKGRTWRLAGGLPQSAPGRPQFRWPSVAVPGVRPVVSAVSAVLAASAAQGLGKGPNVRVGLQSLSRRHTPSCLPLETGLTRPVVRTRQIATLPGTLAHRVSLNGAQTTHNPEAPGAYLGHGVGDPKGQQRYRAGSRDLTMTSANAREQQRPWAHAIYGMQEVRTLSTQPSCDLEPAMRGARRGFASFFDAVPHSRRARMLEPTAEQVQAHPAGLRQAGGGLRRTKPAPSRLRPLGEKPSEV